MQTHTSFKDKWKNSGNDFYADLLNESSEITKWLLSRNGFENFDSLKKFLDTKKRVLDAGCGNGRVTNMFATLSQANFLGVDFSGAQVARENLQHHKNVKILEGNLLEELLWLGKFDFIYCQEVLHHTGDARLAFLNLVQILEEGGEIAIYVYKQKAPVREFVDDFIRDRIKGLSFDESMRLCADLTGLGEALSRAQTIVNVPDVPLLGIKGGEYDIQRFLYHYFVKCFWNPGLTRKENDLINYDWYHPEDCTRHTLEEVMSWYLDAGLVVTKSTVDEYGITMWGKKV